MCPACKGLGKRITVNTDLLLDMGKTIREGAITHPDYKMGGWNWRELTAMDLFNVDIPLGNFSKEELNKLLFAENIPILKKHGTGTYSKNFEGIARKLERLYISKGEDELPQVRKDAYGKYFEFNDCSDCRGIRINDKARSVKVNGTAIPELVTMELTDLDKWLSGLDIEIAGPMIYKLRQVLGHLIDTGVGYLSLNRSVSTLSGGESQRVKMARQLDCDLVDMMYILDEPSVGLHARDTTMLITMLRKLRDKGNSVLVVEHDPEIIRSADWLVDIGPEAGKNGGCILFKGVYDDLLLSGTLTGKYLTEKSKISSTERKKPEDFFIIRNASIHNLKNLDVDIPRGVFTCITGVAGSGKSSLIHGIFSRQHPDALVIDQTSIGRSSRSNPATYIGIFDHIRKEMARATNADASLFSFNSRGACRKCKGMGYLSIEMSFMDDVKIICDECSGQRYRDEVLKLRYKEKNIFEILQLTIMEASEFFEDKEIRHRLKVMAEVGLDYLEIGQSLSSLSGGECQRIKLASELHKKGKIYIMDEPTTGLHMADTEKLLGIIRRLVKQHNTVIVIEHNLDVIRQADWIIDLGPGGGRNGGQLLAAGSPEQVKADPKSVTGKYL
jgi:excinuclease UvrABC ATPase subunit